MKILSADTSAKTASAAIIEDGKVLAEYNMQTGLTHSQTLMPMIDTVLRLANVTAAEIDGFACANGPGSFTGLRIGIGAIKGLSYGLNKPCIGISTLHALANNLSGIEGIICAVMDARCNQVYNAIFESSAEDFSEIISDRAISIENLGEDLAKFTKNIFLVGDGADLCYNKLKTNIKGLFLANELVRFQHAASVGLLAAQKLENGEGCTAADLSAVYLRLPQAERELKAKKQ